MAIAWYAPTGLQLTVALEPKAAGSSLTSTQPGSRIQNGPQLPANSVNSQSPGLWDQTGMVPLSSTYSSTNQGPQSVIIASIYV
jgi:hypothetical protein